MPSGTPLSTLQYCHLVLLLSCFSHSFRVVSFKSKSIHILMILHLFFSGAKHINYYLCSGEDPSLQRTQAPKFRFTIFPLYIISFLIFIILPFKIWRLKRKIAQEENLTLGTDNQMDQKNIIYQILNYMIVFFLMIILLILILLSGNIDPFEIDQPKNIFLLTFTNLIVTPLAIFALCIVYFLNVGKMKFTINNLLSKLINSNQDK